MRILIATDGSRCADTAVGLAGTLRWPEGSAIRVISAVDALSAISHEPWLAWGPTDASEIERTIVGTAEDALARAERELAHVGVPVETVLVRGRAATTIVDAADRWADVVVVGSRGHGRIASMVLGSVSAEIADHASVPVLVARHAGVSRAMLAHDGSDGACDAERLIAAWTVFRDVPVDVVSVGMVPPPWQHGREEPRRAGLEALGEGLEVSLEPHEQIAEASSSRLRASGIEAHTVACMGDPAETIVSLAEGRGADLLVLGAHGRTGPEHGHRRLGNVVRNVLLHTRASVLIAQRPLPTVT